MPNQLHAAAPHSLPAGAHLPEFDGHRIWWCQQGRPEDLPVLILHGGPGGRTRPAPFGWFDGLPVRCIAFDQRGCGRSEPAGELRANTLADLLIDIERLRESLGLDDWAVAGGSWGALLALAYAGTHPQRVRGLFLRSAFLGTQAEVEAFFAPFATWLGQAGADWLGVAEPAAPLALLATAESRSSREPGPEPLASAQHAALSASRLALAWDAFERLQARPGGVLARPGTRFDPPPGERAVPDMLPGGAAIQVHYLRHACFVPAGALAQWLADLDEHLATRPLALVHGLDDAICAPAQTRLLARHWPAARIWWVPGAGHDMDCSPLSRALIEAAHEWTAQLQADKAGAA